MKHYILWYCSARNLDWPCYHLMETTKVLLRKVWALYPPLCKEKVDLNIQVYNTVLQQGLTILVRFCCEECQFLPPSVWWYLCILQHFIHTPQCVCLALKKLHQFQQKVQITLHSLTSEVRQLSSDWLFNFCWRWCNHFSLCVTQIFVPTLVTSDTGSIVFIF